MTLQQQLQLKLSIICLRDFAELMGYRSSSIGKATARIHQLLADDYLGLHSGNWDFKYSDEQFLIKLCQTVGIDIDDYQSEIDAINYDYTDRKNRFKSYVFVDTKFVRDGQPILALAFCEHERIIPLDYDIRVKPLHEQVTHVQRLVKQQQYIECEGVAGIWGRISRYIFYYAKGCKLAISPDGVVTGELDEVSVDRAALTVGGNDVLQLMNNDHKP